MQAYLRPMRVALVAILIILWSPSALIMVRNPRELAWKFDRANRLCEEWLCSFQITFAINYGTALVFKGIRGSHRCVRPAAGRRIKLVRPRELSKPFSDPHVLLSVFLQILAHLGGPVLEESKIFGVQASSGPSLLDQRGRPAHARAAMHCRTDILLHQPEE